MSRTADVRLGIVSYGTPEDLRRCLERLEDATAGLDADVVVIDNGSPTGADADAARSFPVRLVRLARNVGYPRAMNLALAGSDAPVLIALNPDTRPPHRSMTQLVEALERQPDVGLVAPRLVGDDGHLQHSAYAFPSPALAIVTGLVPPRWRGRRVGERFLLEGHARTDQAHDVDWTVGAVHCVRRAAIDRDRVYSERSFMYAEDLELCWYLRRHDWRVVYEPRVEVPHVGNVTGKRQFGATREQRWLDATYDWYAQDRGRLAAWRWAAANTAGLSAKRAALAMSADREHRAFVQELLAFHARRLVAPGGDGHSRRTPEGLEAPDPVIMTDTGTG